MAGQPYEEVAFRVMRPFIGDAFTDGEFRAIQARWLTAIQPEGITLDELSEAIHPSRYVRGSDILDIFGD